jgi:hypothetical protein
MRLVGKRAARRLTGGAAYTYKDFVDKPKVVVPQTAFADVHGAPAQRRASGLVADAIGLARLVQLLNRLVH